jgi:hypothetical protein
MKKVVRTLIIIGIVVVVIAGVALFGMDIAAKKGIEMGGTRALGVDTTVESVSIRLLDSSVSINGLNIANPEGYRTERLIALGSGHVRCDIPSLLTNKLNVGEIILDAPELTLELKAGLPPKSNLGELLDNLKSEQPAPEEKKKLRQYKIDLVRVTNTRVRFHTLAGETVDVMLPTIELRDVKNADGSPVVFADILGQILASMGNASFEQAKGLVPDEFRTAFGTTLKSAKDLIATAPKYGAGVLEGILGK